MSKMKIAIFFQMILSYIFSDIDNFPDTTQDSATAANLV